MVAVDLAEGRCRRRRASPAPRAELAETAHAGLRAPAAIAWAAMADVTDASDLRKAIGVIRRALGPIDLLSTTPASSARSGRCGRSTPTTGGRRST